MTHHIATLAIAAYYAGFVTVLTMTMNERDEKTIVIIAFAGAWPIIAILCIPWFIYKSIVKSAKTIRIDLNNRKLLKEFDEWMEDKDK